MKDVRLEISTLSAALAAFVSYATFRIIFCAILGMGLVSCSSMEKRDDAIPKKSLTNIDRPTVNIHKAWRTSVGRDAKDDYTLLHTSVVNNILYVAGQNGSVQALDLENGKVIWENKLGRRVSAGPAANASYVLVGLNPGLLQALDAKTGANLWQLDLSSEIIAKPAIYSEIGYVHTLDGGIAALDLAKGRQLWRFNLSIPSLMLRRASSPIISESQVFVGFANGKLGAINRTDGVIEWIQDVAIPSGRTDISRMIDISGDLALDSNNVYVVSYQGNVAAYSRVSGAMLWSREMSSLTGVEFANNVVYLSTAKGEVWALTANSGDAIWVQKDLLGRKLTRPTYYNKHIFVADDDSNIHCLNSYDGSFASRVNTKSGAIDAAIIAKANKLYVYSKSGVASAFWLEQS